MSIENGILYRLPMLKTPTCPFCSELIKKKKEFQLLLRGSETEVGSFFKVDVPYCERCDIPYANNLLLNKLRYENRMYPSTYIPRSKKHILSESNCVPKEINEELKKKKSLVFQIVECVGSKRSDTIKIICNYAIGNCCPACKSSLNNGNLMVPITIAHQAIVRGAECPYCKRFFTKHSRWSIQQLLKNNQYASHFVFDEHDHFDGLVMEETTKQAEEAKRQRRLALARLKKEQEEIALQHEARRKECLSRFKNKRSSAIILYADFKTETRVITIVDKKASEEREKNVFRYSSESGREYLSAAYAPQRNLIGNINDCSFKIIDQYRSAEDIYAGSPIAMGNSYVVIEKDGGNYSSVFHDKDCVLADLLLYSPFTGRFEIMESTYNKRKEYYFTDIRHFREYVNKYGKPDIDIEFNTSRWRGGSNWGELNTQSILSAYGYTVNQNDDYPDRYRQMILSEVVDLDILTIRSICDYLDFFIRSHPTDKDEIARSKWEDDLKFISHYKYNPERFLIAVRQ